MRLGLLIAVIIASPMFASAESGTFALHSGEAAYQQMLKREAEGIASIKKAEGSAIQILGNYDVNKERSLCSQADHSREILHKLPPLRDQGLQGWCYAMVAADLASFTVGFDVSAADVAITYGQYDSPSTVLNPVTAICRHRKEIGSGGLTEHAFNLSAAKGFCRESEFPTGPFASIPESQLDKLVAESNKPLCAGLASELRLLIGSHSLSKVIAATAEAIKATLKSKTSTKLAEYADRRCGWRDPSYHAVSSIYAGEKLPVTQRLAVKETLLRLRAGVPAGVGLDVAPLLKPNCNPSALGVFMKEGFDFKKPACDLYNDLPYLDGKAPHEMTAVGAKWTGNTCEIQLRNSWGGNCRCFKPEVHCTAGFISVPSRQLEKLISNVDLLTTR